MKAATVTSYVKETLQRSLNTLRLREAAETYRAMTEADPEEQSWLREWDRADLVTPPRTAKPAGKARA